MFILLLILISLTAFLVGFVLGRGAPPKFKTAVSLKNETDEEYLNFLNYEGDIQ